MKCQLKTYTNELPKNLKEEKSIQGVKIINIRATDLTEMGSLPSKNRELNIYCVIGVFTKYGWSKPLKGKKAKTILNGCIEIVNESKRRPNELWVDQRREFYNGLMQKWTDGNAILMYEGKSVIAESFIRNLRGEIYKK